MKPQGVRGSPVRDRKWSDGSHGRPRLISVLGANVRTFAGMAYGNPSRIERIARRRTRRRNIRVTKPCHISDLLHGRTSDFSQVSGILSQTLTPMELAEVALPSTTKVAEPAKGLQ
jgi:hypothetical protein